MKKSIPNKVLLWVEKYVQIIFYLKKVEKIKKTKNDKNELRTEDKTFKIHISFLV